MIGGLVVGVGAEFLILKLEELWARNRHRTELLAAIDEAEAALCAQFGLAEETGRSAEDGSAICGFSEVSGVAG